ncbi:response regulator transcription factor [Candidatus Gracilibacteria bacterium]|nr:response regulator transcription factor [Candidatus Gracilibacteria bacterium]
MKILLVEDNSAMMKILRTALEKEHFLVNCANDGEEGFKKAKTNKYEIILLDLMLPKRSGFEIIRNLRALRIQTPILVISAMMNLEDRVIALNLGADDYLVKNFSISEFIARTKSLIRRSNKKGNNVLTCKNLVFNITHNLVSKDQKPIPLTRTEFRILLKLMLNKNKLVPVDSLIKSVWKEESIRVVSNKLSVHVRALRKKLGKELIVNQRDFGYMIIG